MALLSLVSLILECVDNLLFTRTGPDGARYQDPNMYGAGGCSRRRCRTQWDKKSPVSPVLVAYYSNASKETEGTIVKETQKAVKGAPTSLRVVSSPGSSGYAPGSSPPSNSSISA